MEKFYKKSEGMTKNNLKDRNLKMLHFAEKWGRFGIFQGKFGYKQIETFDS